VRTRLIALWRSPVSARRFLQVALTSLFSMYVVVTSGAFVRLTASGLGCDNWPRCGDKPYPEKGYHAFIEFGNRVVAFIGILLTLAAWLAARRAQALSPRGRRAALGAFLGAAGQIPLGGITVLLSLHPVLVMSHFFLSLVVVGLSVVAVLEGWRASGGAGDAVGPQWWRRLLTVGVAVCAVMVVTGAVATAAGPHSGGTDIRRLGIPVNDAVYVHVRAAAVFGIGLLLVGGWLVRNRAAAPGVARLAGLLLVLLVGQMILGEVQYRNAIPWQLVLVHVLLSATIWTLVVAIAYAVWRPPGPLLAPSARREARAAAATSAAKPL
jgi:cytochrome c oxidase assembly protein subunit 15